MGDLSKNFSRWEFACLCSCNFDTVDAELVNVLQELRYHYNKPVSISSGCRCILHNDAVGGSRDSHHMRGKAADIIVKGVPAVAAYTYLERKYLDKYGLGIYPGRVHIDVRLDKVRWDRT